MKKINAPPQKLREVLIGKGDWIEIDNTMSKAFQCPKCGYTLNVTLIDFPSRGQRYAWGHCPKCKKDFLYKRDDKK